MVGALLATMALARKDAHPRTAEEEFGRDVELAPFVVRGEQLAISIHARSARDRRYAEAFSEEVVKVVYDGVTERTGKGLVIVGVKGEPHPIEVFRKFEAMAAAGQLQPGVAARVGELGAFVEAWRSAMDRDTGVSVEVRADEPAPGGASSGETGNNVEHDLDFEEICRAVPLPLEGVGAKLYQIGWAERFDDAKLEARLRSLSTDELDRGGFTRFDWVFYLPARGALDRVIDDVIDQSLKESEMGFFSRMAARTVLAVVKPMIRRAIEGLRKGMLFMTVVRAQGGFADDQVSALTTAYIEQIMPGSEKKYRGSEHDRAVAAVREVVAELSDAARGGAEASALVSGDYIVNQ